jgi:hypothetical protein
MEGIPVGEAALLLGGGLVAGVVNTLAGGGSLLTVPLLVMLGLPGGVANGTNRVGILLQCLAAAWQFRSLGVLRGRDVLPIVAPVAFGSVLGAVLVGQIANATFERIFGVVMLLLLVPTLRGVHTTARAVSRPHPVVTALALLVIGIYTGAFQAGVGILLLFALLYLGHDAMHANALKVTVIALSALSAVPVFAWNEQIAWIPALVLAAGFTVGGALGAKFAVRGGERLIRPVLAVAVVALALRMLTIG